MINKKKKKTQLIKLYIYIEGNYEEELLAPEIFQKMSSYYNL
jgi:hypothetical protein